MAIARNSRFADCAIEDDTADENDQNAGACELARPLTQLPESYRYVEAERVLLKPFWPRKRSVQFPLLDSSGFKVAVSYQWLYERIAFP